MNAPIKASYLGYVFRGKILAIVFLLFSSTVFAQLTGVKSIPGDYPTISAAVNDLNTLLVGPGGVTFNIAAGYTETVTGVISLTATGTLANPVIFQKDPGTAGANPSLTAPTSGTGTSLTGTQDGIWRLIGADFVTIDGIDLHENAANTSEPATMEFGYALYKASTSNGCQNVTIQNCHITLSRLNNGPSGTQLAAGSNGIAVLNATATAANTALTPIAGGTNSNNKFYSNTIENCNSGITLIGHTAGTPFTLADTNNDVGGQTALTGNTILNFGGATGAVNSAMGIRTLAQYALNVSHNTINSNNGAGVNHPNSLRGIYLAAAVSASSTVTYNTVTIHGAGSTASIAGIENLSGTTPASNTVLIANNLITNGTYNTATTGGFYGILNNGASPAQLTITGNTISNNGIAATSTGFFYGVLNSGVATSVTLAGNSVLNNSAGVSTTGLLVGIYNSSASPTVNITGNTLAGNTINSLLGLCYSIYNTGAVTTTLNINSNNIGTASVPALNFTAANSGTQVFIYNTAGGGGGSMSISNNNFQNLSYPLAVTGAHTCVANSAPMLVQAISGNTFTNLNVNTSGTLVLISSSATVPVSGIQNINNNNITGTLTKTAPGTLTVFSGAGNSAAGSTVNNLNNQFSNINVTGATALTGWVNADGGGSIKTIQNNTFSNWTAGTGTMTGMLVSLTSASNATTGNFINNFSGAGTITGISTSGGNDRIFSNTINTLSSSGAALVSGISISSGTLKKVFGNKIYDLHSSNVGGYVYGISVSGTTSAVITANVYNNLISDLRAPQASNADGVRGISVTTNRASTRINVYYNTIYLNANSSSGLFGTSGIFHTSNGTATSSTLDLRNNLVINVSSPVGTGLTVAYRRGSSIENYTTTSNNNLFFAGSPGSNRLVFYDGTPHMLLSTFKAKVAPREAQSFTEDLVTESSFLSTSGASSSFLHLDPAKPTLAESGAVTIAGFTTDVDTEIRQGQAGYAGTGSSPDIGADEFEGIRASSLTGTYLVGSGQPFTSLTNAGGLFASINSRGLSGDVIVKITSNITESGNNSLNRWTEEGVGNYTIDMQPDASIMRIISGNVTAGLIRMVGAQRVTIDGSNGSTSNYLTFRNEGVTTGPAFVFINGASNNSISYANIEAYGNATNGTILFGASNVAGGNSNNQISHCNINSTVGAGTGSVSIYSAGTTGNENASNILLNNNIFNYRDKGVDITLAGSRLWTITGNNFYNGNVSDTVAYAGNSTLHAIRILGGYGYVVSRNNIGGSAPLTSGAMARYASAGIMSYHGILLSAGIAEQPSFITGNTIANISVSAVPGTTGAAYVFIGIETNGAGINVGGSAAGSGNLIGSNTANGAIQVKTTTNNNSFTSTIRGISCNSSGGQVTGNQVGGFDINNTGTVSNLAGSSAFVGIYVNNALAPSLINNNIVGSAGTGAASNSIRVLSTSSATKTGVTGISIGGGVLSAVQVDGNRVQNISFLTNTLIVSSGGIIGINSAATGAAVLTIINNTIASNYIASHSTGLFYGITASGAPSIVSINTNTIAGNSSNATAGVYSAIYVASAATSAININLNNIGTPTVSAFTYNAINTVGQTFINNTLGATTATLSINNNNFYGINYVAAGSGSNTYISNTAATLSQTISSNAFNNLNVNSSGNVTFISNSVSVSGTGSQNVNNNAIVTGFTKRAGGIVTLFNSLLSSANGSVINNNNNNFSNITVTGTTIIAGWINTDAGSSTKVIQNNIFTNWSAGAGNITALTVNVSGTANSTSGNLINTIAGAGTITGIATTSGNNNIVSNIIHTLSSSGAFTVTGISIAGGTNQNVHKNKIYNLLSSSSGGFVNGISVSGATLVSTNIFNNLIGDLKTPVASQADAIRGISVTPTTLNSSVNLYYNTIYLNATSTGAIFGTSGIYHSAGTTATTAALDLRNNSITNISVPKTSGLTVAFRRSGAALNNYLSVSNNNLFYAGPPGANRLIYYDGVNPDSTLATYKGRATPRDAQSVTEDLSTKFASTDGASSLFLHMSASLPTTIESGAVNVPGYPEDIDGQTRFGNPGYSGVETAPDIGADEILGIEALLPTITYTLLPDVTSTGNRLITDIEITDASGININPGSKPRIYYKHFSDANVWLDNTPNTNGWKYTEATNTVSPFNFTLNYSLLYGGASVTAGVIQYFIVAQDLATIPNTAINSGTFNALPAGVALGAGDFPITGTINSYKIPFSGNFKVGSTEVFTSLTRADGLFASINSAGLMGNTTFSITSNLPEDGSNALNQWAEAGAGNYTMTIKPDGSTLRIISGSAAGALIRLNGTDRLTINGSIGGTGTYLDFQNTSSSGTTATAVTFINGATNNSIRFCELGAFSNVTNGVVLFSTGGNSNNLIDNCSINAAPLAGTGMIGLYSLGTPGAENISNTISNNRIYNYRTRGLDISATGSSGWVISGNHLFNGNVSDTINYPAASELHGIRVLGGSGYSILNNYIGGNTILAAGSSAKYASVSGGLLFQGIVLSTSNAVPASFIQGNTIASLAISSAPTTVNAAVFTGISTAGSGINIGGNTFEQGNTIGSSSLSGNISVTTTTSSIVNTTTVTGISSNSAGGIINYNRVGSINISNIGTQPAPSFFHGIYAGNSSAPTQINNNFIGSATIPGSIRFRSVSLAVASSLTGIHIGTNVNTPIQVNANRIQNISNMSTVSSGIFTGIANMATSAGAVVSIINDTIQYISSAANAAAESGVYAGIVSNAATNISNSLISNFTHAATGTNAQIIGVHVGGVYATTISGNIIANLSTASQKAINVVESQSPEGAAIIGILNAASAPGQVINNNRLSGFSATSNAGVNVVVAGMAITSSGSGSIFNNKMGTMTNLAIGPAPALCHIIAAGGSFTVYNNISRISNLTNTTGLKVYGFLHSAPGNWNYFHNSVRVGGNSVGIPLRSAAILIGVNSPVVLKNNIFFNIRTGTGTHYAISNLASPPGSWSGTSDFNDFYSSDPNTVAEWGSGANETFGRWQSLTGGDVNSISNAISFITSTYDLEPDSISNCNFDMAGTPITTPVLINSDINSKPRNMVSPDLGAYEFSYTGFTIAAGSATAVCLGDSLMLTVDPGEAISPRYSWRNPANVEVSTLREPTVLLAAGHFKVTVTDSTGCFVTDSTLVTINPRPTATITAVTSVCDSAVVYLNIALTGTGVITGTLSNGHVFSGRAPLIIDTVLVTSTTEFSISALSDSLCTAVIEDLPDTLIVTVTRKGDWLGFTKNWSDPVNWCGGIIPTSLVNVRIPAGTSIMPLISDSAFTRDLVIESEDTLTIAVTGVLSIAGELTNNGTYADNGTTRFSGLSGRQTYSGVTRFNHVILDNTAGLLLPASVNVKGNITLSAGSLNANNFDIFISGNWTNNAGPAGFVPGNGQVSFIDSAQQYIGGSSVTTFNNVTVQKTLNPLSLANNAVLNGNLLINTGTFDLDIFTANRATIGGTLVLSNNATLKIGGLNSFPVNYASVNLQVSSTVEYSGANQAIASVVYGNLTLVSLAGAVIKTSLAEPLVILGNLRTASAVGSSVTFNAGSAFTVGGNVVIGPSTTINGSSYSHTVAGNWMNSGTFSGNTGTITFKGAGATVGGTGVHLFNNLTIAASGIVFSNDTIRVAGNLATIESGAFIQSEGGTLVMEGTAKTISGSGISINNLVVNGTVTAAVSLVISGNIQINGSFVSSAGTITMGGVSRTLSGIGVIRFATLFVTGAISTSSHFSISSNLSVSGTLAASAGTATFTGTSSMSGTANLFNVEINGVALRLSSGAVLGISNSLIITTGALDVASSGNNTVNFNGAGSQNVNSILYSNLLFSNAGTKSALGPISTINNITISANTTFEASSFTHSIQGNWVNNGTFLPGTGTVEFTEAATAYIYGPTTFNILASRTSSATTQLILQSNVSAAIVNMVLGRIITGTNTLTITGTRTGEGIILGNIQRTHSFTTGISYAFEGPQNTITFSAVTGVTSITVSVVKGAIADFPFGGSISREYDILVPDGTYDATLRLHYENDELNGNNEQSMGLWHHIGSSWAAVGKTGNDSSSNYVEYGSLTDIGARWTLSDNSNLVQWNGSASSDWNNAANWTVLQGSGSTPPTEDDIVDLGGLSFIHQPVINNAVVVKSIVFGSSQAVTLTLGNTGSLTTHGDLSGDWSGNAVHTIHVHDQSLVVDGNIILSDGLPGHAINLNIGSGTISAQSLIQSGGANITFAGTGTLTVHEDFRYTSGNFTAGNGTVLYNGDENQHVAHVTYNNVTINKTDGLANIDSLTSVSGNLLVSLGTLVNQSTLTVAGNVQIEASGTLNNFSAIYIQGNWNNYGNYVATGSSTYFNGSGPQAITASTFNNLTIVKPAGTATISGEIILSGNLSILSGTLDLKTFFITRDVAGGTAIIGPGAIAIIGGNNGPVNFTSLEVDSTSTLIYDGADIQYVSSERIQFGNVIFRNGSAMPKILVTPLFVRGDLTIESGATLYATTFTISLHGNWVNSGSFVPGSGTVLLDGTSKTVTGNTTFNRVTTKGSYTLLNDVTFRDLLNITSTGKMLGGGTIHVTMEKDLINSGVLYTLGTTTFTGQVLQTLSLLNAVQTVALTVYFNGSVSPVLNSSSPPQYGYLYINNTAGIFPSVGWSIQYLLNVGNGASFNGGISTHNLYGGLTNNGTITSSGTLNFIPQLASTINFGSDFTSTGTVVLGGSQLMSLAGNPLGFRDLVISNTHISGISPGSGWSISNNLTVNSGSVFSAGNYSHLVGGNFLNLGTINSGTSTFTLNGSGRQNITSASAFNNLQINKPAGFATMLSNVAVNGALNFISGKIETGSNVLTQSISGTVTGASQNTGWVNGRLQKYVAAGTLSRRFEVGDSSVYSPVSMLFSNVTTGGDITASAKKGDHFGLYYSPINTDKSVNRYWTIANNGLIFTQYAADLHYLPADIDPGADTSAFEVGLFNGSSWLMAQTISRSDTNTMAGRINTFGDFAIGEVCYSGTTIMYNASPYCTNSGIAQVSQTGTAGGKYASGPGLTIDSVSGSIELSTSTPGTYIVTYGFAPTSGCTAFSVADTIVVSTAPLAAISYPGSPFCYNGGVGGLNFDGTTGGVFSSTPGLSINALTGAIAIPASTIGTYQVTYTIAADSGCSIYQIATSVTISGPESAAITYIGSPFCSSAGIIPVNLTGTPGGIYTSYDGLLIDSLTGSVNANGSTPGTYQVTYKTPGTGCDPISTSTQIMITQLPSALISYNESPYCNQGTAYVSLDGTEGGNFSSTAGLNIDSVGGNINLAASTPGTYTVTYSFDPAGGCTLVSTTALITISATPSATINYPGSPFVNSGTAPVYVVGTTGGTFTSTNGLVLDPSTGLVNLDQSALGVYTVTYTVPAGGGCEPFETYGEIRIYSLPIVNTGLAPDLGTAANFTLFSISGAVGNTGVSTVSGAIGTNFGAITAFVSSPPACAQHRENAITAKAAADLMLAYNYLDTLSPTALHGPVLGNGETLYAGVYSIAAAGSVASVLNLDAQGNPDAVFIFVIGGAFTTGASTTVNLLNGASSCNVFWKAEGAIAMAALTVMKGTLIANGAISMAAGGTLDGRMFSVVGAVSVDAVVATLPLCATLITTWTGNAGTNWNNECNWSFGLVPTPSTHITIPSGINNYPVLNTGTGSVENLTMQNGATLTVNGAVLKIGGIITNSGFIIAGNGTIEMNGSSAQTIPVTTFAADVVKTLVINNNAGVIQSGPLNITDALHIANGSLATNDQLTLKSTASATARVAEITSSAPEPVIGNVIVERYVPGRRKYRLLTSSVTTSVTSVLTVGQESLSIWGNWQNQGNNATPNTGMYITGGSIAGGYDQQTSNASLFTYNDVSRSYMPFSTANGKTTRYTSLKAGVAYYLFVYGDRTNTLSTPTPNATVIKTTGKLLTGDQIYTTASSIPLSGVTDRYTLLGNPFASPIDWATIQKTNLANSYWGWDPNLSSTGGYITVSTAGDVILIAPFSGSTGLNQYIQPGQGFFVKTTAAAPTMTIREQNKSGTFNANAFRIGATLPLLAINLQYANGPATILADGVLVAFDARFSNRVGVEDAAKMKNTAEALSVVNGADLLSIDARQLPVSTDTIPLNMVNITRRQYNLQIFAVQADAITTPYLHDSYLKTRRLLSVTDTNNIAFNTDPTAPASLAPDRFRIVFGTESALPVSFISVKAVQKNNDIEVSWNVEGEVGITQYEVERSADGILFQKVAGVLPNPPNRASTYTWLDKNALPGTRYYRIKAIEVTGKVMLSDIVQLRIAAAKMVIKILPNPVTDGHVNVNISELDPGIYNFIIVNAQGQQLKKQTAVHTGGTMNQTIVFDYKLTPGVYYLHMVIKNKKHVESIFVE